MNGLTVRKGVEGEGENMREKERESQRMKER